MTSLVLIVSVTVSGLVSVQDLSTCCVRIRELTDGLTCGWGWSLDEVMSWWCLRPQGAYC